MVEKFIKGSTVRYLATPPSERLDILRDHGGSYSVNRERASSLHGQRQGAIIAEALHPTPKELDR